jgi:hypothetical protein
MLMRRTQGRRSQLQFGPTSRTRDSVWFLFPWRNFEPVAHLPQAYSPIQFVFLDQPSFSSSARKASVGPEEMFKANIVQTRFCFLTSIASGRDELVVDRNGRFPS